jgi:NADP-dependent 3-hydroxy acid dehydrogenase YdfG
MDRWEGKVAVVTGASSGIGAAIAVALVKAKMTVVGIARRLDRMQQLKDELPEEVRENFQPFMCDVTREEEVVSVFKWVDENYQGIHVLVNNAGILRNCMLLEAENTSKLRQVIDTNIMGVAICSREAFQIMKKRGINDGHIVHINSITGHNVQYLVDMGPSWNIYHATKHAVTAMTETMRQEFLRENTNTKISVCPQNEKKIIYFSHPKLSILEH